MLGYPADVREIVLGEGGVLEALKPGSLLIDMTTSEPALAVEIHEAAAAKEVDALDAPVSGGDVGARNATLVIMVGGDAEAFERAEPLLCVLGQSDHLARRTRCRPAQKMVNQIAIAAGMIGRLRGAAVRPPRGTGSRADDRHDPGRRRGFLVAVQLRAADPARRPRAGLQDRPLRQGPRDRACRGAQDEPLASGDRTGRAAVHRRSRVGLGEKGTHALSVALGRVSGGDWPVDASG